MRRVAARASRRRRAVKVADRELFHCATLRALCGTERLVCTPLDARCDQRPRRKIRRAAMPVLLGQIVFLRAATADDVLAMEPLYVTLRDVGQNTRQPPRPDHVRRKADKLAQASVTPDASVSFSIVTNVDGALCGLASCFDIDLHHRSARRARLQTELMRAV